MSRAQLLRIAIGVALGASLFGCAANNPPSPGLSSVAARGALVVVQNYNTRDVNLYVVTGSSRVRIGTAPSLATSQLRIPAVYLTGGTGVVLQADPIGSTGSYTFPAIQVSSTDRIELQVASALPMSSFGVYASR